MYNSNNPCDKICNSNKRLSFLSEYIDEKESLINDLCFIDYVIDVIIDKTKKRNNTVVNSSSDLTYCAKDISAFSEYAQCKNYVRTRNTIIK